MDVSLDSELCEGCVYGKTHRRQFGTRIRATKPGEVFHTDVCGPFCYSLSNYRYFVLFKDDYSGFRFVYFMMHKHGIHQRLTMPYTPQQNGCNECGNRTLVEAARAMRLPHQELPHAL